jgi:type I restriction enzyme M protein
MLKDDLVEAVIGLGPQLFYGTGIPACIMILRPKGGKPEERRGKVIVINADKEYREGRAQNYLDPEHVEKIVAAFSAYKEVPGFAHIASLEEIAGNDFSLNIRRYVDTTPPADPQNVQSHLTGGVPRDEVDALASLLASHGVSVEDFLKPQDERVFAFKPEIASVHDLRERIEADPGLRSAEGWVTDAVASWWDLERKPLDDLKSSGDLVDLRAEWMKSFAGALSQAAMLDEYEVSGIVASWWGAIQPDVKALMTLGYHGLVEAWVATVLDALGEEKARIDPLDHKVARALLPEYLVGLTELETVLAEQNSRIEAAKEGDEDGEPRDEGLEALDEQTLKSFKKELTATKKKLKQERAAFGEKLSMAAAALADDDSRELVLAAFLADLQREAAVRVSRHRDRVVAVSENWWTKYKTTLKELEASRETNMTALAEYMKDLGYE